MKQSYFTVLFGIVTLSLLVVSTNKGYRTLENQRTEIDHLSKSVQLLGSSMKSFEVSLKSMDMESQSVKKELDLVNGKVTGQDEGISTLRQSFQGYELKYRASATSLDQKVQNIQASLANTESAYNELKEKFNKITMQQAALLASDNIEKVDLGRVIVPTHKER